VIVGRETATSALTGPATHELLQLLLLHVCQVDDVAINFLKLVGTRNHTASVTRAIHRLGRLHAVVGSSRSFLDHETTSLSFNSGEVIVERSNVVVISSQLAELLLPQPV
jgi:hypothetical protein